jgi:arylsulfatase A-like enzyme
VPFIVVAPGITTPGSTTDWPVSLLDIYPTLVELAGLERPEYLEGNSLVPLLRNPSMDWDYPTVSTYGYENHAVVSSTYKLIRYADGSEELYDTADDPNEWTNLAGDPRFDAQLMRLATYLPSDPAPDGAQSAGANRGNEARGTE